MTPEQLVTIIGVAVSLAASYLPKFKDWYDNLTPANKQLFMLGAMVVVVGGAFGFSCVNLLATFACTLAGAGDALLLLIQAMIANQATYLVTKHLK